MQKRVEVRNWVEAALKIYAGVTSPAKPAVVAAPASLFGEWAATLISREPAPSDPNVRQALDEALAAGAGKWPGATLPDIGQLTAQASRIATDIAAVANRVQTAFDTEAVAELRRAIREFGQIADRLATVANEQADVLGSVGTKLRQRPETGNVTDGEARAGGQSAAAGRFGSRPGLRPERDRLQLVDAAIDDPVHA